MCSWKYPGIWLKVIPEALFSGRRFEPKVGAMASYSPPRMPWTSLFVSATSLKSTSARPAFLPYQNGFFFRVVPWPFV